MLSLNVDYWSITVIRASILARCVVAYLPAVLVQPLSAADYYDAVYGDGAHVFTVATGSPGELGLLEVLATAFNKRHDTAIRWKKAGSGASLLLLKQRHVDVALVHAPEAERRSVAQGWAVNRTPIGSNQFYIVGPKDDPAGVSQAASVAEAYARIARAKPTFLSRGDNSGTHRKELAIWEAAGIRPSGDWYLVSKDFMLATLRKANEKRAYFMSDSSTWVTARGDLPNLKVLFRGDPALVNRYHALCQPVGATKGQSHAARFVDFLRTEEARAMIRDFGKNRYGEPLYHAADHTKSFDQPQSAR
jgi:tungstate transport system substrate-binding protein